jgi:hypothetical protein
VPRKAECFINESNLIRRISYLTPGDGFRVTKALYLLSNLRDATGQVLSGATVPVIAALENNFYGLQTATGQTFMGKFTWVVPQDYDEDIDNFDVLVACNMAGNTDSGLTITPTIYRKRPIPSVVPDDTVNNSTFPAGLALSADLGCPTSKDTIPLLGANLLTKWVRINCSRWTDPIMGESGNGTSNRSLSATADASLKCGDIVQVSLACAGGLSGNGLHAADAINTYGLEIWYRSNLAFTNIGTR